MNKEFADRWVADLRDPNNKQCKSQLSDGVGFCCLGRAVVVGGFKLVLNRVLDENDENLVEGTRFVIDESQDEDGSRGKANSLDERVREVLGLDYQDGATRDRSMIHISGRTFGSLAHANDQGVSFAEIADWVEKNWERL
jgi:hypothetical protein